MAKKRHHMTKHQYNAFKKNHRQHHHAFDSEEETSRHEGSGHRKQNDGRRGQQLRNIRGYSDDLPEEEDEDDLKAAKTLRSAT